MTPQRWQQVKHLFQTALQHQSGERKLFLAEACADDSKLLSELESLLASHDQSERFMDRPAVEVVSDLIPNRLLSAGEAGGDKPELSAGELSKLIPDYQLVRVCGRGAFGTVWVVKDRAGVYRAMKVIELGKLARRAAPHREMTALEHYCRNVPAHPNLAQIFHIGRTDHLLYYTMELADDFATRRAVRKDLPDDYTPMTLQKVMSRGRLNTDTAVEIILRLLNGVSCLHGAGLAHRDIKPANIIFEDKQVKLADLTLVRLTESRMSVAGTPNYMPPDEKMDASADTYAVGKVLFEMITGCDLSTFPRLPHDEQVSSSRLDLQKLADFLLRACASSAADRFVNGAQMREALLGCRFPLHDSPLLELAREESSPSGYVGSELAELQRATAEVSDEASSSSAHTKSPRLQSQPAEQAVWSVLDRFIRLAPWIVLLILGLVLINKLL